MALLVDLLHRGIITSPQAMAALQLHLEGGPPLLQLAVFRDVLSAKELARLLTKHAEAPERTAAALMLEEGFCTAAQLQRLRQEQASRTPSVAQALLALEILSPEALARACGPQRAA